MSWRTMSKRDRGLVLAALATLAILACAIVAQVPPPSDANSLGAPDRNIENENCYCHTNAVSGKEPSDRVAVLIDPASPDRMVTNGNITILMTITYADATDGTRYGFAVDLDSPDGKSLEGAALSAPYGTPSENKTHLAQSEPIEERVFNVTLTAPSKAQDLKMVVMGIAVDRDGTEKGDHWNFQTKVIEVYKKREVAINATVLNTGDIEAKDINLTFSVGGDIIGVQHIPVIPPNGEYNVTHMWDATFFDAGEYKIVVELDSNRTNLELNEGNNKLTKTIILEPLGGTGEEAGLDMQTIGYYLIAAIIILVIIGILYRRFA